MTIMTTTTPPAANKNPSTTFFWNDWDNDKELAACSLAAQGLWMRCLCIAARSPEPGVVQVGSLTFAYPQGLPQIAAAIGRPAKEIAPLFDELLSSGAVSLDDEGRLMSRRMVRTAALSRARSDAGTRGADRKHGKGGGKPSSKLVGKPAGKPPPSSRLPDFETPGTPLSPTRARESHARPVSADWLPSDQAQQQLRAARPDLDEPAVQRRLFEFRNWCAAQAVTTHNPDATWLNFMMRTHATAPANGGGAITGATTGLGASLAALADFPADFPADFRRESTG
jgi:hypothetical protein